VDTPFGLLSAYAKRMGSGRDFGEKKFTIPLAKADSLDVLGYCFGSGTTIESLYNSSSARDGTLLSSSSWTLRKLFGSAVAVAFEFAAC
jgi:hypothetical protein